MVPSVLLHIISVDPAPDSSQVRKAQELSDADLVGAILTRPYTPWLLAERQRRDRERFATSGRDIARWRFYMAELPGEALMQFIAFSKDPFYREEWELRSKGRPAAGEPAKAPGHTHSFEEVAAWLELATRAEEAMRSVTLADDEPLKRQLDEALQRAAEDRKAYETALREVLMAQGPVAVGEDLYAYQPHTNRIKKTPFRWGATVRIPCPRLKIRRDEEAPTPAPTPDRWDEMFRKA